MMPWRCPTLVGLLALGGATGASAAVAGRVVSLQGEPLARATVVAHAQETMDQRAERLVAGLPRPRVASTGVDALGTFRLGGTPAVVDLEIRAPGYAPAFATVADGDTVTLALRPALTVRGVVLARGQPVVGATVAWSAETRGLSRQELVVRTRGDGSYEVPAPAVWASGVVVTHPDFAPCEVSLGPFEMRPQPPLRLELDPGTALSGKAVDAASGRGVAGATIVVDGWPLARSTTDGSFTIRHAGRSWRRVVARAEGLVGEAAPRPGNLVVVSLKPARRLTGVVRDAKTGTGIAGAVVALHDGRSEAFLSTAVSDAGGRYAFVHLGPARYTVWWTTRPGYARSGGGPPDAGPIDLRREVFASRELHMSRLRRLVGRVQDEQGRPLAGALLRVWAKELPTYYAADLEGGVTWPTTWTAPDGTFTVALENDAAAESEVVLLALKQGYGAGRAELAAADARPRVVTLSQGVELAGRVTTPDGAPLPGVSVALAEQVRLVSLAPFSLPDMARIGWTESDAQGRFVTRVHDTSHLVALRKSGYLQKVVHAVPGAERVLDVVLEPAVEVRGRVLRSDGSGVAGVQLFLTNGRTMMPSLALTTNDGGFRVGDLSPGTYEAEFRKTGTGLGGSRTVTAPDHDVVISMPPSGTLRGTVTDAWTRAPIDRFSVAVAASTSAESSGFLGNIEASVDGVGGSFAIDEVPLGAATLTVRAEGHVARRLEAVEVVSGTDGGVLEIALDAGARVHGTVTDESGVPVADVRVSVGGEDGEPLEGTSDESGAYDLRGIFPGKTSLEYRRPGYITARRTVVAEETTRVDVTLPRGLAVSGVVLADGDAVPGARLWAHSSLAKAEYASASSDESGRFTLEGLVPGRYTIEATTPDGGVGEIVDVDVSSAGWLRLSVETPERAGLSGWVTGLPSADEFQMVSVRARAEGGRSEDVAVDANGWFRMDKAPAGTVRVQAVAYSLRQAERSTRAKELTLPPGSETEVILEFVDGHVVSGYVSREGAPVAGASVSFRGDDASGLQTRGSTDADGRYELFGLEPGPYTVSVWGRDLSRRMEYTVVGDDRLDIDATGAALSGVVLDVSSGAPLADASVSLWQLGPRENTPDESLKSDARGEFAVRSLESGRYRVLASKQGFGQQVREADLVRGEAVGVVLELEPSAGLTLEVVDARDGRPLDATVVVRDATRRIVANEHSGVGNDGTLNVPLAPGQYVLSTSASGYGTVTRPVLVPRSGLRVGLTPGGTLILESERVLRGRVRLVDATGEEYVRCWCNGLADIDLEGRRTRIEHVTPGTYRLEVVEEGGMRAPGARVVVREGEIASIAIE